MSTNQIASHFSEAAEILLKFNTSANMELIQRAGEILVNALKDEKKIISCGNGGSMCDSMHFAEELTGRYRNNRKAIPAISISDPSHLSCVSNDYGYEFVFSRFVEAFGQPGEGKRDESNWSHGERWRSNGRFVRCRSTRSRI